MWLGCGAPEHQQEPPLPGFTDNSGSAALISLFRSGFSSTWGNIRDSVRGVGLWSLGARRWALDVEVRR